MRLDERTTASGGVAAVVVYRVHTAIVVVVAEVGKDTDTEKRTNQLRSARRAKWRSWMSWISFGQRVAINVECDLEELGSLKSIE
jgi:hypothetical protein